MAERFVDRLDVYPGYWRSLVAGCSFHGHDFANNTFKKTDKGRASRLLFLGIIKLYPVRHLDGQDNDKPPVRFPLLPAVKGINYTLVPPCVLLVESSPVIKNFSDQQQAARFLADLNIDQIRLNELSTTMGIATTKPEPVKQRREAETKVKGTQKPHAIAPQIAAMAQALMDRQFFLLEQQPESRPPKHTGPEDLPVKEHTPKPYTLGPHEEPGYVPPPPVVKSDTEKRKKNKENHQKREQVSVKVEDKRYKEQDAAAKAALKKANPQSIKDNLEYGGVIYQDKKTGEFGYTGPIKGTDQGVNPFSEPIPQGAELVGDYHTHADYSIVDRNTGAAIRTSDPLKDDFNSDNFSSQDIKGITEDGRDNEGYKGYLGTPGGQLKVYDPATGKKSLL